MQIPDRILPQWLLFLPLGHEESYIVAIEALIHNYEFALSKPKQ